MRTWGTAWSQAREYPLVQSEGLHDLTTRPSALGGHEHTFVWDVGSLISDYKGKTAARAEFMQSLRAGQ